MPYEYVGREWERYSKWAATDREDCRHEAMKYFKGVIRTLETMGVRWDIEVRAYTKGVFLAAVMAKNQDLKRAGITPAMLRDSDDKVDLTRRMR